MPSRFECHAPGSLDEAVAILEEHGGDAQILAGGTDLIPQMKQRKAEPKHVVNIKRIPARARSPLKILSYKRHSGVRDMDPQWRLQLQQGPVNIFQGPIQTLS